MARSSFNSAESNKGMEPGRRKRLIGCSKLAAVTAGV